MKSFKLFVVLVLFGLMAGAALADCLATVEQAKPAQADKKLAVQARDGGDYVTAAAKFQQAASEHPQEAYAALYLLNAEGCLVGKFSPVHGYLIDHDKAVKNSEAAYVVLDQVKALIDKVVAQKCSYDSGVEKNIKGWYKNAKAALEMESPRVASASK